LYPAPKDSALLGRQAECSTLQEKLGLLVDGQGGLVLIEGEPGIGKSQLVSYLAQQCRRMEITLLIGRADAFEQASPYFSWRGILARILRAETFSDPETRRTKLRESLEQYPELAERVPLLNCFFDIGLPDNDLTEQMSGQVRADNIQELVLHLVREYSNARPCALVIEDVHWLDSASWNLTRSIAQRLENVLVILTSRTNPSSLVYAELHEKPGVKMIGLGPLEEEDVENLVCQRLGARTLPASLASFILDRSQGNPLFAEHLAYALRDSRVVDVSEGVCRVLTQPQSIVWPDSVHGVILSRIDGLDAPAQLTLKVASVIGRRFDFNILEAIFPVESDRPGLKDSVERLQQQNLTVLQAAEPELSYTFKHVITRDVAYDLLLLIQRRELHRKVGLWYEHKFEDDLSQYLPVLAYHWRLAGDVEKSLTYLDRSGESALRNGAYQETVEFHTEALRLSEAGEGSTGKWRDRSAQWECNIGEALYSLGRADECKTHLEVALKLLGHAAASSRGQLAMQFLREVWRQARHRFSGTKAWTDEADEALIVAARAYGYISKIFYMQSDPIGILYSALRMLNLAEAARPCLEQVEGLSLIGLCAGLGSMHKIADFYRSRAHAAAEQLGSSEAKAVALVFSAAYYSGLGRWDAARAALTESMRLFEELGNNRRWTESSCLLSTLSHFQGDFNGRLALAAEIHKRARMSGDAQSRAWGLLDQAESLLPMGQTQEANMLLAEVKATAGKSIGKADWIWFNGLEAVGYWQSGDARKAAVAVNEGLTLALATRPAAVYTLEGYAGLGEIALELFALDENSHARAKQACRELRKFAQLLPIGRPRAYLTQGVYCSIIGAHSRALRYFRKSLNAVTKLRMPYEQALAQQQLAACAGTRVEREQHFSAAAELFAKCRTPQRSWGVHSNARRN
jgi:tetratricopeptide (TPR) repeat protein